MLLAFVAACGRESRSPRAPELATQSKSGPSEACPAPSLSGDSATRSLAEVFPVEAGGTALVLEGTNTELAGARAFGLMGTRSVSCADRTLWWIPGMECDVSPEAIERLLGGAALLEKRCFSPLGRDMVHEHCTNGALGPKACARVQEGHR
jgi:hypothetical protein